jgi:formate dehydrogenase subunit gamma
LRTDEIPLTPVPLSSEQAEVLLQRQIKKHHVAIMLLHWFNASVWLLELITGLALISSPLFRVVPQWYISIVEGAFGSRAHMLQFHVALGVAWILVFLVYAVFGFRTYLRREVLEREIALDRDDFRWLIVRTLGILGRSREPLPQQGIYNAGQKLFALVVYAMIPVVMLTGVVMAFQLFGPQVIGWAIVLHFSAVGIVVSGLLIHVYMGAVFPEEKPAFFSMITGSVDELYAYSHHYKWWREARQEQQTRRALRDTALAAAQSAEATPSEKEPPARV